MLEIRLYGDGRLALVFNVSPSNSPLPLSSRTKTPTFRISKFQLCSDWLKFETSLRYAICTEKFKDFKCSSDLMHTVPKGDGEIDYHIWKSSCCMSLSPPSASVDEILYDIRADVVSFERHEGCRKFPIPLWNTKVGYVIRIQTVSTYTRENRSNIYPGYFVERSYSQFRSFYQNLLKYSDSTRIDSCCSCTLGTCPFWSIHLILRLYSFPQKTVLPASPSVVKKRRMELNQFLRMVLVKLQGFHQDLFLGQALKRCIIIKEIQSFLGLHSTVIAEFLNITKKQQRQLSLAAWYKNRLETNDLINLY